MRAPTAVRLLLAIAWLTDATLASAAAAGFRGMEPTAVAPAAAPAYEVDFYADTNVFQPDGKLVVAGIGKDAPYRTIHIVRFNVDGSRDATFGIGGTATYAPFAAAPAGYDAAYFTVWSVVVQRDGKLLVGAEVCTAGFDSFCEDDANGHPAGDHFGVMYRFNPDGSSDGAFNAQAPVVPGTDIGFSWYGIRFLVGEDQRIVAFARRGDSTGALVAVAGFGPDGTRDPGYSGAAGAVQPDVVIVREYYNSALDRYFYTADPALQHVFLGRNPGWFWYYEFLAWPAHSSSLVGATPVCHYDGLPGTSVAESHFYSADVDECALMASGRFGSWTLHDADAFDVRMPNRETGACLPGDVPFHRLWNGRADGGHVLVTDPYSHDGVDAAHGYVAEGYGPDAVTMCGPRL